ncbi:MAG: L-threonylcarbamoyladenylate synthase [Patescibacteria group bacterium]|nr:L-threonylcarbamoyladenylate synthase [Patescibacteria group bacterium]
METHPASLTLGTPPGEGNKMETHPQLRSAERSYDGQAGEGDKNVKIIKINRHKVSAQEIGLIVDFLKKGKTIVYPTDTIYGLGCSATDKKAIDKIRRMKKRDKNKPFLILIADFKMVHKYFKVDKKQASYLRKIWPGKVSVILNKKSALPGYVSAGLASAAVRLPKSEFLTKMIKELKQPIVSTSLNKSGQLHLVRVADLTNYFTVTKPDLIVDAGTINGKPSKLIDLRDAAKIKVLRK